MDGFTGFKIAAEEEIPEATAVMDPFDVVRPAGDALERGRRRVQQQVHGHRGRNTDPLYKARQTLPTGADLLTDRQYSCIQDVFDADEHVEVEATWAFYQHLVACLPAIRPGQGQGQGQTMMATLITKLGRAAPKKPTELTGLGRTLKERPRTSWPTSTAPAPRTAAPRRSTIGSSTCAARPWASET
jgi:transposase